jgi:hypothetical protein
MENMTYKYKILDHKWNNLKRWVESCEKGFTGDGLMPISKMGDMMRTIQAMNDVTEKAIIEAISGVDIKEKV